MWWNFIWRLAVCAGSFLWMGKVQLRVMWGVSTGWLQKPCSQTLYLTTFEHTPSHSTDSFKPILIILHTVGTPGLLTDTESPWEKSWIMKKQWTNNLDFVHISMHLVLQVPMDSSQKYQVSCPRIQLRARPFRGQILRHLSLGQILYVNPFEPMKKGLVHCALPSTSEQMLLCWSSQCYGLRIAEGRPQTQIVWMNIECLFCRNNQGSLPLQNGDADKDTQAFFIIGLLIKSFLTSKLPWKLCQSSGVRS